MPDQEVPAAPSTQAAQRRAERVVLHVDMDAFFASVEQLDEPSYRGRPVVVGADPKAGEGRGVVAAASYEARRYGIHSAMPITRAYRACPDAVFVRGRMWRYRELSREIRAVFHGFAGNDVEPVSIDEAYLEAGDLVGAGGYPDARAVGAALKQRVFDETGLRCSVGVAPCKSAAKIASDMDKPDGLTVVPPGGLVGFLAPLPVRRISGVGPKTAERLEGLGIETIGDLAAKDETWVDEHFGKHGLYAWHIARGEDDRPVEPGHGLAKSRSEEHTFYTDTADPSKIHPVVRRMATELVTEMRRHNVLFRVVGTKIRTAAFETSTRATTLKAPTDRLEPVMAVLREQLKEFVDGERAYRLVGVRLAGLERDVGQKTLEELLEEEGEDPTGRLSRFPPWSVPDAAVARPGQQRFGKDL